MPLVYNAGLWTIILATHHLRDSSPSLQGDNGELFRKVVLVLAAGMQTAPKGQGRGCHCCPFRSDKALKDATKVGEEQPVVWLPADKVPCEQGQGVIPTYNMERDFVL